MKQFERVASFRVHREGFCSLLFVPGRREMVSSDHEEYRDDLCAVIRFWDPQSGQRRLTLRDYDAEPFITVAPDGATMAWPTTEGVVGLVDVASGAKRHTLEATGRDVTDVMNFSPDGSLLVGGGYGGIHVWSTSTWKEVISLEAVQVGLLAFAPDSRTIAIAKDDGTIVLWNLVETEPRASWNAHDGVIRSLAVSPDGRTVASSGDDRAIRVWDAGTGKPIHTLKPTIDRETSIGTAESIPVVHTLAYVRESKLLATGDEAGGVKLWDLGSGDVLCHARVSKILSALAVSSDGRTLVGGSGDGRATFWRIDD